MDEPLFSIITVCLNAGPSLRATNDSVREQISGNFEHIVKDGGSKDDSVKELEMISRTGVATVISRQDSGIYDAMNQALEVTRGKYVLFLNAGDTFYAPDVLLTLAPFCVGADGPSLVYTDHVTNGKKKRVRSPPTLSRFFLYRTMLCHQVCFIRRKCFDELGGFDTALNIEGDFDFLVRLMLRPGARSQYVPIIGISSLGGGISSQPGMFPLMDREVTTVRKKYFHGTERLAWAALYVCTLPRLRRMIYRSPKLSALKSIYLFCLNLCYELLGKATKASGLSTPR
jgi:glycosyltransferase involved in cell wall biosynthesis